MNRTCIARRWLIPLLALALTLFPTLALAQAEGEVIAEGLNGPMGVLLDPDGNVWVIDSGVGGETEVEVIDPNTGETTTALIGDTARIVMITPDGEQTEVATLPSLLIGQEATGGARLALVDGVLYATTGAWLQAVAEEPSPNMAVVVKIEDGAVTEVARPWEIERDENPDGFIVESHPFGIAAGAGNRIVVADAGANTLISINPNTGRFGIVAVFPGLPTPLPDFANPTRGGTNEADPVPTGIAFDADGNGYVSLLAGFPFIPGTAKVMKITADGATLSDYATGLTSLIDIRTGPDGQLYAVQFAEFGEQGPAPDSGAIVRVKEGTASEIVLSGLPFPTSLDFSPDGDAYVTINGVGAPGSGAVTRYAGLTSMAGMTMTLPMTETAAMTETVYMTDTEEPTGTENMTATVEAPMVEPAVTASDQQSDGTSVTVDNVVAAVSGWMVIHSDENGNPGPVLGQAQVEAGSTDVVVVTLDNPLIGDATLWAMLHVDEGEAGVYEFPGADVPVIANEMIVMAPFAVTIAAPAAEEAEAKPDEAPAPEVMPATGVGAGLAAVNGLLAVGSTLATLAVGSWITRRRRA